MKALELQGRGLESLARVERAEPLPGFGEARVSVRMAALNFRDLAIARGEYPAGRALPLVPGSDLAGVVDAVGPGVAGIAPGDRVVATYAVDWTAGAPTLERMRRRLGGPLDGGLAERVVVPAHALVRLPDAVSFADAATLPVAGVTAWRALFGVARLAPGDGVLLFGTGGVSTFALQLAARAGARAIVVSGDPAKRARAEALGASVVLDRRATPDLAAAVRAATGDRGVDVAVDVVGGETTARAVEAVRPGGAVVLVGFLEAPRLALDVRALIGRQLRLEAISTGTREDLEALVRAVAAGALRPVVDRIFPFDHAIEAFTHLAAARHVGKVLVEVSP